MPRTEKSSQRDADIISFGMQKGGVAKTTNAIHVAAALAERGRRVLLWDVDENYGATKVFGLSGQGVWTTMDVLSGDCTVSEAIIEESDSEQGPRLPPGVDFVPSSRALQGLERAGAHKSGLDLKNCLARHIDAIRSLGHYDYIIIDTGPHASACTRSAYLVSDYFILCVIPEMQAIASLPDALRDVVNARRNDRNPHLHLLGLILSCMDRRLVLARHYEDALTRGFVDRDGRTVKFETSIGIAAAIGRAYKENKVLLQVEPNHRVSRQYRALAGEVEDRIRAHRSRRGTSAPARTHDLDSTPRGKAADV